MSQTETLLLFVLGFCAALFVVLLFGRGVWGLLGSWAAFRDHRMQPAAIRELRAERDALKAEKAMMVQKLEASVTDMKMRMAEQMAEVSRNRNRLLDMTETLKARDEAAVLLQEKVEDLTAKNASLTAQIQDNVKSITLAYAQMGKRDFDNMKATQAAPGVSVSHGNANHKSEDIPANEAEDHGSVVSVIQNKIGLSPFPIQQSANANDTPGNPLIADSGEAPVLDMDESVVDRSVSNVLSLAERVRSLQSGMKKA